ncbi:MULTISPECIES: L-serine ammonia-lyase [Vibrio]|uniref:L-serine dehydratase n=1 Tax=Vibrio algicola TaxID=2662262 RepID=A0A5Q0TKH4_9VIBR|nr:MULTISPECIES: L-serine ammonia-lyase [Vibrio]MBD1577744.1 L-serine ammonia-lyase [Vibrio sp. S11_S32]
MLSIFDIFKIGVGPSSSHTNGPMIAGFQFSQLMQPHLDNVSRIRVDLYGSLSLTGIGHHTDRAVILGVLGNRPDAIDIAAANQTLKVALERQQLALSDTNSIEFDYDSDIQFLKTNLPLHENGMVITALNKHDQELVSEIYYSIGGGFILTSTQMQNRGKEETVAVEFPFHDAESMLQQADSHNLSLAKMVLRNELSFFEMDAIRTKSDQIWQVMSQCMQRGFETEGILDGGLGVVRRAPNLRMRLESGSHLSTDPMEIMDWINLFAFAVSEENAAGGQVVTSPTNGAAGVIPAVLMYYHRFIEALNTNKLIDFFAIAGAIGILYKTNASISGAEVGCQGEIGVSSSMAAAGLAALCGGTNEQICVAAEIAMEHSLGMTCDPIGGLVQVPCIERNAMGAMKAINASRMALRRNSKSVVSLDKVIATMFETGKDMNRKYRETSLGGLALIHLAPPCE